MTDNGLRPLLDFGRCCHESVPERDREAGGDAGVSSAIFFASTVCDEEVLEGVVLVIELAAFSGDRERSRSGKSQRVLHGSCPLL
jgi:hypothetical protein